MPLFEYRCKECGNTFEELVWGDRDRPIPCPHCGNQATEKLISVIGGIALGRSSSPACDAGCIAGAVIGTICGVLLIAVLAFYLVRRYKSDPNPYVFTLADHQHP